MRNEKYYPPTFNTKEFHCPYCGVFARQNWFPILYQFNGWNEIDQTKICICFHCRDYSIWYDGNMIKPSIGGVPLPNSDLPSDIVDDYIEARDIINMSPRGASALLRLAIQKLCKHLGQTGKNINNDVKELVKGGLSKKIQQSLDYVRVIGNNAVHPGQIDLKDDKNTALKLFNLINIITEVMITQPKEIDELYNTLPDSQKEAIEKRDNNKSE